MSTFYERIAGTTLGSFIIGLTGVRLKNSSGSLQVRTNDDTGFADVASAKLKLNDAFAVTVQASPSQTADVTLTLPVDDGTANQVLQTDGSGVLSWASAGTTSDLVHVLEATVAFGSTSPIAIGSVPVGAQVLRASVVNDTAFDGTPSMSIGVSGDASKYLGASDNDLTYAATSVFEARNGNPAVSGSAEAVIATLSAGSASVGSARVQISYVTP